jgi:hypothetical protein
MTQRHRWAMGIFAASSNGYFVRVTKAKRIVSHTVHYRCINKFVSVISLQFRVMNNLNRLHRNRCRGINNCIVTSQPSLMQKNVPITLLLLVTVYTSGQILTLYLQLLQKLQIFLCYLKIIHNFFSATAFSPK